MKLACHFILSRLPDEAVVGVFESLAEDYSYQTKLSGQSSRALSADEVYPASEGSTYERPVFHVAED
jgi:hypothetical protein